MFSAVLHMVRSQPNWKFTPPRSLDELASLVKLQIQTVVTLYGISDYPAPYIGGEPQVEKIAPPSGAVTL